ncbi:MAG: PKD domain-containing protein [Candidatus Promineifilaceae bacterium]|nr:PKD domain-containing protein [Candidatus Promineifilaceae bacterium]
MRSRRLFALAALAAALVAAGLAFAAADGLIFSAFTGGGGRSESDGAVLRSAVGQAVVGRSDSGDAVLCAGWPGCQSVASTLPAPLLLVDDDDNTPDVRGDYTAVLDALDVRYNVWDTGGADNEPDAAILADYQAVLWFTGANNSAAAGPGPAAEADLSTWLDAGNCLFLSAQDYIFRGGASTVTAFMQDYLGLRPASGTEVDYDKVDGQGAQFGGLGTYHFATPLAYNEAVDELLPDESASTVFEGTGGGAPRSAAVAKDSGVYRTTFWGFPSDFLTQADHKAALNAVLDWCRIDVPIAGLAALNDGPTVLGQTTTLTATISAGTQLSYTWDLGDGNMTTGRVVAHNYTAPGTYTATVTAANALGSQQAQTLVAVVEPIAGLAAADDSPTALGHQTALTATLAAGTDVTYQWDFGDGSSGSGPTTNHVYGGPGTYVAEVTATNPVSSQTAQTIVEILTPVGELTAASDSPTALGAETAFTATLSAGDDVLYEWDFGDGSGVGPSAAATASHTYAAPGTYTATVTALNAVSSAVDGVIVTVLDSVDGLSAENSSPTALGDSTVFTATVTAGDDLTYSWDFGDGQADFGPLVNHTYAAPGTYTATVTASNAVSSQTAATEVVVIEPVSGLAAGNDSPTLLGAATQFTATISSGGPLTYTWEFGDNNSGTGPNPNHTYASAGIYTATVTAENSASSQTAETMVTVLTGVSGLSANSDSPTSLGQTTRFTATVTAGDDLTYSWDFGDGSTGLGSTPTHIYAGPGSYTAVVTATNAVSTQAAPVAVLVQTAVTGLSAASDGPTLLGQTTQFTATVTAGDDLTYSWDFGDGSGGSGPNPTHTYSDPGSYTAVVTASNAVSSQTAETVVTVLNGVGGLSASSDSPTALTSATQFTATVTAGDDLSYSWDFGDGSGGSGPNPTHTYSDPGSYTAVVTASNAVSSQTAETIVLVQTAAAGLSAANDGPTLLGQTTQFTATVTAGDDLSYSWDFGDGSGGSDPNPSHTYAGPGTYTATVTAGNAVSSQTAQTIVLVQTPVTGLSASSDSPTALTAATQFTATVTAGDDLSYSWDFGDGQGGSGPTPSHLYLGIGTYTATVTAANAVSQQSSSTVVVVAEAIEALTATNDSPTVAGETTTLNASIEAGSGVTYLWDLGDGSAASGTEVVHTYAVAGTYTATVTATNVLGQEAAETVVTVAEPIGDLIATNSGPTLLGESTVLTATITGGGDEDTAFTWRFGDGAGATGAVVTHTYGAAGAYTAVVTATSPVDPQSAQTTVDVRTPVSGLAAASDGPTRLGSFTAFTATISAGSDVAYHWDFGDGSQANGRLVSHGYSKAGTYTATVTAENVVSRQSASVTVIVLRGVQGLAAQATTPTALDQATQFTATVTAGDDLTYTWDFGDGSGGSGASPSHTYVLPGTYEATVTAANAVSSATAQVSVSIVEPVGGLALEDEYVTVFGQATRFEASLTQGSGVTFSWDFGDGTVVNSGSDRVVTHTYRTPGSYLAVVTASNLLGEEQASGQVQIQVPVAGLTADNSGPTPLGQATTLTATTSAGTDLTYSWDFGDGNVGSGAVVDHIYAVTGIYTATVTAANAVSSVSAATGVEVVERLLADFSAAPTSGQPPLTVTFTNLSSGPVVGCLWDFGDGATSDNCSDPQHTYSATGAYTVTLTVHGGGQTAERTRSDYIQVADEYRLYLPALLNGSG